MKEKLNFQSIIGDFQLAKEPLKVEFGGTSYELKSDDTKAFFYFNLLHSYPKANANGMTFTLPILAKAVNTAFLNPLDLNHKLEGNPPVVFDPDKDKNEIIGTMLFPRLVGIEKYGEDIPLVPDAPIPMQIIGFLWKRVSKVQELLIDIANGIEWKMSMEVVRDVSEDMYIDPNTHEFYTKENIPDDIQALLAIGGKGDNEKTSVNFWGGAMTLTPADDDAKILSISANREGAIAMAVKKDPKAKVRNRGDVVFPADSKNVTDDKDHFSINNIAQARNALARVAQYSALPNWATGLTLKELQNRVRNAVKNKYPKIKVKGVDKGIIALNSSVQIISDTTVDGTVFYVGGQEIENLRRLYFSMYKGSRQDYISCDYEKVISTMDGFEKTERFELRPKDSNDISSFLITNLKGDTDMGEITAQQLLDQLTEKYKDYISPDDHKTVLDAAVDKAKADAKGELETAVEKAKTDAKAEIEGQYTQISERKNKIKEAGLEITIDREKKAKAFSFDDKGDTEFDKYVDSLKASQNEMLDVFKEKKINVTDELKKQIASFDGKDDPRFLALLSGMSLAASKGKSAEVASFNIPGSGNLEDENEFSGVH